MQESTSFFTRIFADDRIRIVSGIVSVSIAIFFLLSFVSFIFSWQNDQSELLHQSSWEFLFSSDQKLEDPAIANSYTSISEVEPQVFEIQNWGGRLGALVSKKIIHDWFGVSSFLLVYLCVILGLYLFKIRIMSIRSQVFILLLSVLVGSLTLGYIFNDAWDANFGGFFGYYVSYYWLGNLVGKVTAGLIVLTIFTIYLLFTFKNSLSFMKGVFKTSNNEEHTVDIAFDDTTIEETLYSEGIDNQLDETVLTNVDEKMPDNIEQQEIVLEENTIVDEQETEFISHAVFEVKQSDDNQEQEIEDLEETEDEHHIYDNKVELEVEDMDITNTMDNNDEVEFISTELQDYDPTLDLSHYTLPPIDLLENHQTSNNEVSSLELADNKNKIEQTLGNYGIQIDKISATIGPTITLYEIVPAAGVRISKIKNLEDDIALSLSALGIRIIAPIPGKGTIGIEVPNKNPEVVSMRSIIASKAFQEAKMDLPVALGKTISNETYVFDLTKMPHLLVAGATGQGKSVGLNAIMTSLLYKKHPAQLKFVLVDPKKVELTLYQNIEKHFLAKLPDEEEAIITDTQKVVNTLNSLCIEMDNRYDLLKEAKLRNIKEYNERFIARRLNPEKGHRYLPYIVVVIDEFADLIITAGKEVEIPLARLAQLARAIGIHLIIATQRPAANIITGAIKANFPARLAFRVASGIDSRTILDATGANQLIGKGDLLITKGSELVRVQCAFIDTPEVEKLTNYISQQQSYSSAFPLPEYKGNDTTTNFNDDNDIDSLDSMFEDAARIIVANQQGSTSLLQRKLKLGYNRAGRIMDQLEAYGVVGAFEGSKARQVLIVDEISLEQLLVNLRNSGKL
jgi:S-DNA-T family DNA segregation ATPase FtsK/SpoIIIE